MSKPITLTDEQLAAVRTIEANKFVLFTGPPGAGKTTTLSHWLRSLDDIHQTYCFAPTGRAAQRMMEAFGECGVNLRAKTIHAGLIPSRTGYDGNGWTFFYNKENQLPCSRVVIDEMSMLDSAMAVSLFQAIKPGTQVVMIGDPDQLPPVSKGKPFIDMIDSGVIPHAKLTTVHRFAGRIAQVCQQINGGKLIVPSPKLDVDSNAGPFGPENFRHIECRSAYDSLKSLDKLIDRIAERKFNPAKDVQLIVARNSQGEVCREKVNMILQEKINPRGRTVKDCPFREGDKVMCLHNAIRDTVAIDGSFVQKDGGSRYVANGESGLVLLVTPKEIVVDFGGNEGLVPFTKGMWTSQVCLGYAITSHKSQGGGFPVVVYMIDDTRLVDRTLTYTAVSRGKHIDFSVGRLALMQQQCQKISVLERKTFMRERLMKSVDIAKGVV